MANRKLKAVDFFCGAGGMSCGLSQAGIKVLAGIDIDTACKETYLQNHTNSKFINKNIKELSVKELQSELRLTIKDDHMVFIGCSPCQYWTQLHTTKNKSSESKNLLVDFLRFIEFFLPGFIIVENVPGVLKKSKESKLDEFKKSLQNSGYTIVDKIINTNEYGVPQKRNRYLLLASRVAKDIKLPEKTDGKLPTVKDFIGIANGFPEIPHGNKDLSENLHSTMKMSEINLLRIKQVSKNGGTRDSWESTIPAYEGKDIFPDTYGRMSWDKPAPTITTKFISISNGRFGHPEEDRAISLREGAALQTFPKTYKFIGNGIGSIARQIGNAVPPKFAKSIGLCLVENK